MKESLLNLPDDLSKLGCELFSELLRYIGELPASKSANSSAQEIVQTGIDKKAIRDEIYLQLVRQTTANSSE
jgi:hypothetical protein